MRILSMFLVLVMSFQLSGCTVIAVKYILDQMQEEEPTVLVEAERPAPIEPTQALLEAKEARRGL